MRIDAHQHFWKYNAGEYGWIEDSMAVLRRDFLPADVAGEMALAGVDACVAVQARQTPEETGWLLTLAEAHRFIAGVVGWVDLQADAARPELERLARHPKVLGIRHIVQSEPDDRFLLRPAFCRGIALLGELGLSYDILVHPRHLPLAADFVSRFERQRFVLDHLGKPEIRTGKTEPWERDLRRLAAFPNVFCKLSGLVTEAAWRTWTPDDIRPYLDIAFDCFGWNRLMIGSDWPVCTVAGEYSRTMALVTGYLAGRPSHERDAVLGGNAGRFWKIPEQARMRIPQEQLPC